jgi:hypothetical protein
VRAVILLYPNGQRLEALLSDVPRVGEHIRLADSKPNTPSLEVEHVLWVEGTGRNPEPEVIVSVHEHKAGPRG